MIMSASTENYLKTVYEYYKLSGKGPKPGMIAGELGISSAAATDMARKLAEKKLVNYRKYMEVSLTPEGEKMALSVVRKHRLWETFLYETFGLSLHEIHREAEMLEHQTSEFMVEKLSEFLGDPLFDPHGDPIPARDGKIVKSEGNVILSAAMEGRYYEIVRLPGSDKEFFDFCLSTGMEIGTKFKLVKQYEKNELSEIYINNTRLMLGRIITDKVLVIEIKNN